MFACKYFHHTPSNAVLANHCTPSSAYTRYTHCLAGCMYDPVIPVHCTARVSLWQPLCINWSVPLAPVRAYDRCTEGWTETGSENEPSFKRKRLSLQNRARNPSRNPRASRGGPNTSPRELVGPRPFTRYRLLSRRGSLSLSDLSSPKTETVVGTAWQGRRRHHSMNAARCQPLGAGCSK